MILWRDVFVLSKREHSYSIRSDKLHALGWRPAVSWADGIARTRALVISPSVSVSC
jgi:hypothetical protein